MSPLPVFLIIYCPHVVSLVHTQHIVSHSQAHYVANYSELGAGNTVYNLTFSSNIVWSRYGLVLLTDLLKDGKTNFLETLKTCNKLLGNIWLKDSPEDHFLALY